MFKIAKVPTCQFLWYEATKHKVAHAQRSPRYAVLFIHGLGIGSAEIDPRPTTARGLHEK